MTTSYETLYNNLETIFANDSGVNLYRKNNEGKITFIDENKFSIIVLDKNDYIESREDDLIKCIQDLNKYDEELNNCDENLNKELNKYFNIIWFLVFVIIILYFRK